MLVGEELLGMRGERHFELERSRRGGEEDRNSSKFPLTPRFKILELLVERNESQSLLK